MTSSDNPYSRLSICGLILCAGQGQRAGLGYNKILHYVGKKTILEATVDRFVNSWVSSLMLVISPNDEEVVLGLLEPYTSSCNINICYGGATRTESVRNGLKEIGHCDVVVIHDGARPYVKPAVINKSIESAVKYGSGIVAVPTVDTIKVVKSDDIIKTLSRNGLFNIQTPQAFVFNQITAAYQSVKGDFTDDSEVYTKGGFVPKIVVGDYENIKITTMQDYLCPATIRSNIGVGFDAHKLAKGRLLVLGGVHIPHEKGLLGHSDADALTHAIMDALLSAAGLPDIGKLFTPTSVKYKDISSIILLKEVMRLISERGFEVGNISAVIMAEKPKMSPYIEQIRVSLSTAMLIHPYQINISATTTEGLGIIGREQGIAASATCLLYS